MEFLNALKLNTWWSVVLWLGLVAILIASLYDIDFLANNHLFGLGIGLVLVGLSYTIAEGSFSFIKPPNAYTGGAMQITQRILEHSPVTYITLGTGIVVTILFLGLIIFGLV